MFSSHNVGPELCMVVSSYDFVEDLLQFYDLAVNSISFVKRKHALRPSSFPQCLALDEKWSVGSSVQLLIIGRVCQLQKLGELVSVSIQAGIPTSLPFRGLAISDIIAYQHRCFLVKKDPPHPRFSCFLSLSLSLFLSDKGTLPSPSPSCFSHNKLL